MLPVAYNLWEFVEFFYYLSELGYDDWFAYDVMSKEIDTVETFEAAVNITRKLEALARRIDREKMKRLTGRRDPVKSLEYLYGMLLGSED